VCLIVCDLETSTTRRSRSQYGCYNTVEKKVHCPSPLLQLLSIVDCIGEYIYKILEEAWPSLDYRTMVDIFPSSVLRPVLLLCSLCTRFGERHSGGQGRIKLFVAPRQ